MPQVIKIGNSAYQLEDPALGAAIENLLAKQDSLTDIKTKTTERLDALTSEHDNLAAELSETRTKLDAAMSSKVELEASNAALKTRLDEEKAKFLEKKNKEEEGDEDEMDDEDKKKKSSKMDSDEVKSYCQEFLAVVSEVSPALKKADAAFEPDFSLTPLDYKATYLKSLTTLPAEAKARIDSEDADRETFVNHLYLALKPQLKVDEADVTRADAGNQQLSDSIEQNRRLTADAGSKTGKYPKKEDSPTMKARKERQLQTFQTR